MKNSLINNKIIYFNDQNDKLSAKITIVSQDQATSNFNTQNALNYG
jgi:hypothetical protein